MHQSRKHCQLLLIYRGNQIFYYFYNKTIRFKFRIFSICHSSKPLTLTLQCRCLELFLLLLLFYEMVMASCNSNPLLPSLYLSPSTNRILTKNYKISYLYESLNNLTKRLKSLFFSNWPLTQLPCFIIRLLSIIIYIVRMYMASSSFSSRGASTIPSIIIFILILNYQYHFVSIYLNSSFDGSFLWYLLNFVKLLNEAILRCMTAS